jgi:hypothetical protein
MQTMQFRLSSLFTFTAICGLCLALLAPLVHHWDLRSYYVGFYGRGEVPAWASGTGSDRLSESIGSLMAGVWSLGPWICLFGVAAILLGAWGLQMKGGAK